MRFVINLTLTVILLVLAFESIAQTAADAKSPEQFLMMSLQESAEQRKFLHGMYTHFQWLFTTIGALAFFIIVGFLTYFNLRTKNEMVKSIASHVVKDVKSSIDNETSEIKNAFQKNFDNLVRQHERELKREAQALIQGLSDALRDASESALEDSDRDAEAITKLNERIAGLERAIAELQAGALEAGKTVSDAARIAVVQGGTDQPNRGKIWLSVADALLNHKFVWRSIERLAMAAGTTPQVIDEILKEHKDDVKLSVGNSGRRIARHRTRQPKRLRTKASASSYRYLSQ